jgi:hypothetical protein
MVSQHTSHLIVLVHGNQQAGDTRTGVLLEGRRCRGSITSTAERPAAMLPLPPKRDPEGQAGQLQVQPEALPLSGEEDKQMGQRGNAEEVITGEQPVQQRGGKGGHHGTQLGGLCMHGRYLTQDSEQLPE